LIELCEPSRLTILIEPVDSGAGLLVRNFAQAAAISRQVASPFCKALFDVYAIWASGGEPLAAVERHWSQIGYFQFGDFPGRKEPGTGEIDFGNLVEAIGGRGFQGVVGMEHGNSLPGPLGEIATIDAYVALDDPLRRSRVSGRSTAWVARHSELRG
jgi:hydroxypyruvate isomerase